MLTAYAAKWFVVYYFFLGVFCLLMGGRLLIRTKQTLEYLQKTSADNPPYRLRIFLKYFLVFTLPTFFLSFFSDSWIEVVFAMWCLIIIYMMGSLLLRWNDIYPIIKNSSATVKIYIRTTGAMMLSVGVIMFLLFYRILYTI